MKFNRVQEHLLSLGYPIRIVREYHKDSKWYKEEVRDYYETKKIQGNREECRVSND